MKNLGGVDCGKLVREKPKGVFAGKRLEVKQERRVPVVVLDSGTVGRTFRVRFAARKNERRAACPGELPQDGIDRATRAEEAISSSPSTTMRSPRATNATGLSARSNLPVRQ